MTTSARLPAASPVALPKPVSPEPSAAPAPPAPIAAATSGAPSAPVGGRLIVEPDRLVKSVAIAAFVPVGADAEPQPGARHLLERLLLGDATPAGALASRLRARGSQVLSFTAPDYTVYQVVTPAALFSSGLELVEKLLRDATVCGSDESALLLPRQQVLSELAAAPEGGEPLRRLFSAAYVDHPYALPLLGSEASLVALHPADLCALYQRHYRPERLTLVIVGDVDEAGARAQVADRLGALWAKPDEPQGGKPPPRPRKEAGPVVVPLPSSASGAALRSGALLGFAIPPSSPDELPALDVAAKLLAGDGGATPREPGKEPSFVLSGKLPGMFVVSAASRPEAPQTRSTTSESAENSPDAALRAALTAALRLGQHEVSIDALLHAEGRVLQAAASRSETPAGRALRIGALALLGLSPAAYEARLRALSPATLRAVLARYLVPENLTLMLPPPARARGASAHAEGVTAARDLVGQTAAAVARSATGPGKAESGQAVVYRLRSGARLALIVDKRVRTTAVTALWPGGQRLENERSAGLHELLGRAFGQAFSASPEVAGFEALVEPDAFGVRVEIPSIDTGIGPAAGLDKLREFLEQPPLSDADVERSRRELFIALGTRKSEAARQEAGAARTAWRLFRHRLLGDHPYALAPTEQTLTGFTRRRLLDFYRQHYRRDKLVLAVVGDFEPGPLLLSLGPWLGEATPLTGAASLGADSGPPAPAAAPAASGQVFQMVPTQQAHLVLGFAAPGAASPERAAVEVLLELLSGKGGRLERALLFQRGLAYTLEGLLSPGLLPGYLAFYLSAAPAKLEAAEATLRDELHKIVDHPADPDEVAAARERLLSRLALSSELRVQRAWQLARAVALGLPDRALSGDGPGKAAELEARLFSVTVEALQEAARAILREDQMVRAAAIPATQRPVFGILPPAPRTTPTRYLANAPNVVSRSAQPGHDRGNGARSKHLPHGRGSRSLPGRLQGVAGHAAALRREARR